MSGTRHVILLPHGFQPEYEVGFANGLARNDWSSTLIGSDLSLFDRFDDGVEVLNLRGSQEEMRPRWRKALNMLRYWLRCYGYLLSHRGTPVHVIGKFSIPDLRVSLIESLLTRLVAGPYVLTVHELLPHDRHNAASVRLSRLIYRTASVCMVHTERMSDSLRDEFGVDPARIVVVEHGIDRLLPSTEASRQGMRCRLGATGEDKVLLFFGNLAPYKGVDILLQAFDQLADRLPIQLVIAGRCRAPSLRDAIQRQIDASPNHAAIQWLDGYFPDKDLGSLFHAADALVMPYRQIDQSGVVFMALATGLRVVASDVGSLGDYIPSEFGRVVPPGDVGALAEGIETVLRQPDAVRPQSAVTRYMWSSVVRPMLPIYARLTGD